MAKIAALVSAIKRMEVFIFPVDRTSANADRLADEQQAFLEAKLRHLFNESPNDDALAHFEQAIQLVSDFAAMCDVTMIKKVIVRLVADDATEQTIEINLADLQLTN
jgi:hypothetical protein